MGIDNTPTSDQFRPVVLRVLAGGNVHPVREIREMVADDMNLSDGVRAERIPSGQKRYQNRIGWACSGLTQAGLLERPQWAHYRITSDGLTVNARGLTEYSEKDMFEWSAWQEYQDEIAARKADSSDTDDVSISREGQDPIEIMASSEQDFNAQTETDLRKRLQASSPEFFEKAVIELLWAMGYGGAHGEKRHVGGTGDGGIDGVIQQDALGLTNVYIQAKRYADNNLVTGSEITSFIGALAGHGANLGVFITTSKFRSKAIETAKGYPHGKIVLVDGIKLTALMLAYGVAVDKTHEFSLFEIDEDFFVEDFV